MFKKFTFVLTLFMLCVYVHDTAAQQRRGGFKLPNLRMVTSAFKDGGIIPAKYTFRGGDVQPGFKFLNPEKGTVCYAIILHDIDVSLGGGTRDILHWIAWNIPASAGGIPEGGLPKGSVVGTNLMGKNVYMGPGAPPGKLHHYVFELYALNAKLDLPASASRKQLMAAMQGKVIAKAAYVGRYAAKAKPKKQ